MAFEKITEEIPLMDEEDDAEEDEREIFNRGLHGFINYFKKTYIGERVAGKFQCLRTNISPKTRGSLKISTVLSTIKVPRVLTSD